MTRIISTSTVFPTTQLIEWSEFTVRNTLDTTVYEVIENRELSSKAVSKLLMNYTYNMFTTTKGIIGYSTDDSQNTYTYGISEADAFSDWIIGIKKKEKSFKNVMPTSFSLTQGQYDGLVIFYIVTGQITKIHTIDGIYDLRDNIFAKDWETVASKITYDQRDFKLNRQAGTMIMLGDYGNLQGRSWMRNRGIQHTRRQYGYIADGYKIRQAEHSYYRETQKFLPNMSEMRQREVVNYYRANP